MNQSDRHIPISALENKDVYSLLFDSKQMQDNWFQAIQKDVSYEPLIQEIKQEAKKLLNEPMQEITYSLFKQFSETGSRLEYEMVYFSKRRRLNTFAFMSLLKPENKAVREELHNIIWSICDEYTWCLPAHLEGNPEMVGSEADEQETNLYTIDLFAAETAFTLSEILQLTKHLLDPLLRNRMRQEINRRVLRPYMKQTYGWETATHNWASVCAGSIGATALHLLNDQNALSHVLERVLETMEYYLEGFNDDGTCLEGYGYWQYGFGYYVYFADLLKKKTNSHVDLFNKEKVHQIALFQQKTFLYKNKVVNFSDAQPSASIFLGLSHYLAHVFSDVEVPELELRAPYAEDHTSRWAPAFRNLLWFDPQLVGQPWQSASYYLQESQWLVSRHEVMGAHFSFAAKGGHNAEPHNHNDIGHFILQRNHETYLKDLGSGVYNAAYFGDERYSFICTGSHGHSVPIINGKRQQAGETYHASVQSAHVNEEDVYFQLDMTHAYNVPTLEKLTRTFTWEKAASPMLTLVDDYTYTQKPDEMIERLIAPVLAIEEDADGIILQGEEKLKMTYDKDQLLLKVNELDFVNHFGEKEQFLALDFYVKSPSKACTVKFEFQFVDA